MFDFLFEDTFPWSESKQESASSPSPDDEQQIGDERVKQFVSDVMGTSTIRVVMDMLYTVEMKAAEAAKNERAVQHIRRTKLRMHRLIEYVETRSKETWVALPMKQREYANMPDDKRPAFSPAELLYAQALEALVVLTTYHMAAHMAASIGATQKTNPEARVVQATQAARFLREATLFSTAFQTLLDRGMLINVN